VPAASGGFPHASVSISLHLGRTSISIGTYEVTGGDAEAMAAAIDKATQLILRYWPKIVYSQQIRDFLVKGDSCQNPGR
jgi:hypothetical protein